MNKKLWLCGLLFFSAHAGEFTHRFTQNIYVDRKPTQEEELQEQYRDIDLKQAQEMLARGCKIPKYILISQSLRKDPELVLFYVGVAGTKPAYENENTALMWYVQRLGSESEPPKALLQNLIYVGVPLEVTARDGRKFNCEDMLREKLKTPEMPNFPDTLEGYFDRFAFVNSILPDHPRVVGIVNRCLRDIAEAKSELKKAREDEIEGIKQESILGRNLTSLVLSYAFENYNNEHVMPAAIRTKIEKMQWEQDELRDKHKQQKRLAKNSALVRLFNRCCCDGT